MEHVTFSTVFTLVTTLLLAVLFYRNCRGNKLYRVFGSYCLSVMAWSLFLFLSLHASGPEVALRGARALHFFAAFIPVFFVQFIDIYLDQADRPSHRAIVILAYAVGAVFLGLSFTPLLVAGVVPKGQLTFYTEPGPVYSGYVAFWVMSAGYGLARLAGEYARTDALRRNQLSYLIVASFLGFLGAINNFLLVYNIVWFSSYSYGSYLVVLYALITAYAIMIRRLLDIQVIIRRAAVFAGLSAFVYAAFATLIIRGSDFFKNVFHWDPIMAALPAALVITAAIRPLEKWLTHATDRFLFQKKYDYRHLLKVFTREILTVLELKGLAEKTVEGFAKIVRLEFVHFFIYDNGAGVFNCAAASGISAGNTLKRADDPMVRRLTQERAPVLAGRMAWLPVFLGETLTGFLVLGPKNSGEAYTLEDLEIFSTVTGTLAVAVANARLFEELSATQAEAAQREKMAVIGTLAAGINHEVCNPLGIARGSCECFLMDLKEGLLQGQAPEAMTDRFKDTSKKVIQEIDRAIEITKRLADFAKPARPAARERLEIGKEIRETVSFLKHELKLADVTLEIHLPESLPRIEADRRQLQEAVFNIVRNAIQAITQKPGRIEISGSSGGGRLKLKISDNGAGIPQDKISRIFSPFYTTKLPGKGTGLGLFIVKQLVEKNGGIIRVESREGEGTDFWLDFPALPA